MGKITNDLSGNVVARAFYWLDVPFDDQTASSRPEPDWVIVPRNPTNDALEAAEQPTYLWLEEKGPDEEQTERIKCELDPSHTLHVIYKTVPMDAFGEPRLAPFIPISGSGEFFAISADMKTRLEALRVRGANVTKVPIIVNQSQHRDPEAWCLQFAGKCRIRAPKIVDAPNRCPFCAKGKLSCDACGYTYVLCPVCERQMIVVPEKREGPSDKRLIIDGNPWRVLDGRTWDGSDLVQSRYRQFASKRFIDWLLRIHAAPFYAEPVWLWIDDMSDEQKGWLKRLETPLEA